MLLSQQLATAAQKAAMQPAIHYLGKDLRFREFTRKVSQLSYLYQKELGQFSRVALLASNCPAAVASFFALSNARSMLIPLDPSLGFEELGKLLKATEATHLAISSDKASFVRELIRAERLQLPVIEIEKKMGGEYDASFTPMPESPPKDTDIVLMLRTGGVSESSRLVAFDHNRLQAAVQALRGPYRTVSGDRFLSTANWFHPFSFFHGLLFPILNGNTCVIEHGVEKKDFSKFLWESKVTRLITTAESAREILHYGREAGGRLGPLRSMVVGVGSVTPELEELATATETPLLRCYGQTENGWTIAMEDHSEIGQSPRPGPRALSGLRYKVMDANGDEIEGKQERTGALAVMGGTVMVGYRGPDKKEYEKATKMKIRGTWLYTGDVATLHEDKEGILRVQLRGRREQLLENHGKFIAPDAIDHAIRKIPGVLDGAGFITHDMQENPVLACAFVREESRLLRPQDVLVQLRLLLQADEVPVAVALADSIPRTLAGINRCRLARQFSGIAPTEVTGPPEEAPTIEAAQAVTLVSAAATDAPPAAATDAPPAAATDAPLGPAMTAATPSSEAEPRSAPVAPPAPAANAQTTVAIHNAKAAAIAASKQPQVHFLTFDLDDIVPGEALPASLYLYLEFRFVVYLAKGVAMSRAAYDRLQFNRIRQLFVQEQDIPVLRAWSEQLRRGTLPIQGTDAASEAPARFRQKIRDHTLELFQSPKADERLAKTLEVSRKLLDEVTSTPYATRPLAQLQSLAAGTVDHSINVSMLSVYLALQMGYSHQLILQHVGAGALLHDFGKSLVTPKEGETSEQAMLKMREHPALGAQALEAEGNAPKEVVMIVGQHHERYDGAGFPKRLRGNAIYDLTRIVSIANEFDNLVGQGKGDLKTRQLQALRQLEQEHRAKFDPQKFAKAIRILDLALK
ncbi:MAG: AMP-binding protein [Oligoflexia bacterium]|nr:AMP-binding protein [Oligoflexia bacterium]